LFKSRDVESNQIPILLIAIFEQNPKMPWIAI